HESRFTTSTEQWSALSFDAPAAQPQPFSGASSSFSEGRLMLTAPQDASNYFGFWQSAANIPYTSGKLYRALWEVSTDQATPAHVPSARFRLSSVADGVNVGSFQFNASGDLKKSNTNSNVPPLWPATRTYSQYFQPVDLSALQADSATAGLRASFDIIDFAPAVSGSLSLDRVTIETLDPPELETGDLSMSDIKASQWSYIGGAMLGISGWQSPTTNGLGTGTFSITVASGQAGSTNGVIGLLHNTGAPNPPLIPVTTGQLYRATFGLTISDAADRVHAPRTRLRLQDNNGETASEYDILSRRGGLATPNVATTSYDIYLVGSSYAGPTPTLSLGFDVISFDSRESGTINLEEVSLSHGIQPFSSD
ncbi:MAG: hypothetical protein V2A74_04655, partial [bacterium]